MLVANRLQVAKRLGLYENVRSWIRSPGKNLISRELPDKPTPLTPPFYAPIILRYLFAYGARDPPSSCVRWSLVYMPRYLCQVSKRLFAALFINSFVFNTPQTLYLLEVT